MLTALLLALAQAATPAPPLTLPSPSGDPAPLSPASSPPAADPAKPPAAAIHPAAARRARFVYKLPDGTIWDSFYYVEFRQLLADFDALKPKSEPTGKLAAWGFKAGKRAAARPGSRPHPLWHSLRAKPNESLLPFIYVNTAMLSRRESDAKTHFQLGKQVAPSVYEFTYHEYPADQYGFVNLPIHASLGLVQSRVEIPSTLPAKPNTPLSGEFLLVPIGKSLSDMSPTLGRADNEPSHRLIPASTLRMSPADYAAALKAGQAELIEWTFKRNTQPFTDPYTWTRTVIDTTQPAN